MTQENLYKAKFELKELATKNIERCLAELSKVINNDSEIYNEIIALKGRISEVKNENRKGIINENDKTLRFNQIRNSVIEIIDQIKAFDLAGINTSRQEIKLLIDFTKEIALLESKMELFQKENQALKNELEKLEEKTNYQSSKIIELQRKINEEKEKPELLKEIQGFYNDYQETIDYFPRFNRILSTLAKNEFFEEDVVQNILKYYDKLTLRELDYFRFTLNSIMDEKNSILGPNKTFNNVEGFEERINNLMFFRKTFDTEIPKKNIEEKLVEAQNLLDEIHINGNINLNREKTKKNNEDDMAW